MLPTRKWLTVEDASIQYSVSRSTLYEWIRDRAIVSVSLRKRGYTRGSRRILAESLDELFNRRAAQQADEENYQQ